MGMASEWVSVSEGARLTGLAVRTIKCMVAEKKLKALRSPGGHLRVKRADLDRLLRPESAVSVSTSSVLQIKRERVEELSLELQETRARRALRKLNEEDAEADRRRGEAQRAEMLANKRALAELRLQQKRDAEERKRAKLSRQREDFRRWWMRWANRVLPEWLPTSQEETVTEAVERAGCNPREPEADVRRVLDATIARAVAPFRAEREAWTRRERLIEDVVRWMPFFGGKDADKARPRRRRRVRRSRKCP